MTSGEDRAGRVYGRITPEVRAAAVEAVARLLDGARSATEAVRLVAENVGVHPNSVRTWAIAGGVLDDPSRLSSVRAKDEQVAVLTQLNQRMAGLLRESGLPDTNHQF